MNNLPYYFSETWKKYEIDYLKFNNYNFIKDLSYEQNSCKSIILLFEYEGKNILRGYSDTVVKKVYLCYLKRNMKSIHTSTLYFQNI